MIMIVPIAKACSWEKENNQSENADLKVCYVLYTLFLWVSDFLTSCLAFFNIILEIFVTCQRIRLITKKAVYHQTRQKFRPIIVFALVLAVSLAIYSPVLFMNEVRTEETRNETTGSVRKDYFYEKTAFGKSNEALYLLESITALRVFLVIVVLTVVNIVAAVIYAAFYRRKGAMKHVLRGLA
jgi:phosphatidylglycerophosphate synthase